MYHDIEKWTRLTVVHTCLVAADFSFLRRLCVGRLGTKTCLKGGCKRTRTSPAAGTPEAPVWGCGSHFPVEEASRPLIRDKERCQCHAVTCTHNAVPFYDGDRFAGQQKIELQ